MFKLKYLIPVLINIGAIKLSSNHRQKVGPGKAIWQMLKYRVTSLYSELIYSEYSVTRLMRRSHVLVSLQWLIEYRLIEYLFSC